MGFKEVSSLDADVTIALGKINKETGKPYPKQAEGYYLGNRKVENKRGESTLHFLQTPKGNLGIWGTTDLNRKLQQVGVGVMVRITSTGTKPTPNGDMYTYKVETDKANTIEVETLSAGAVDSGNEESDDEGYSDDSGDGTEEGSGFDEDAAQAAALVAAEQAAKKAKVQEILARGKAKKA
jgi:hypothetical protein